VLSWAPPQYPPVGHTNPLEEAEVYKVIFQYLPQFTIDHDASAILRAKSRVGWIKNHIHVLRRRNDTAVDISVLDGRCSALQHMVYSGQELLIQENTHTAGECCETCSGNPDCRYWTWGSLNKICRLLKTKEYELEQKGFVAGGSTAYLEDRVAEAEAQSGSVGAAGDVEIKPPPGVSTE